MTNDHSPLWLQWARELQGMSQTGLAYSLSPYDTERYQRLGELAARMVEMHTRLSRDRILEDFAIQPGYATVKVDVRGAIVQAGKVLLVQERSDGQWCLPGGWADVGERPSEMVTREVREESGFEVQPVKIVGVYDANRGQKPSEFFHAYKIVFLCNVAGGSPRISHETSGVEFFSPDTLPPLSINRTNPGHIQEVMAHTQDPSRPAAFD